MRSCLWAVRVRERPEDAEAEFLQTIEERPLLGSAYVRFGMLYGSQGRFDEALDILSHGKRLDPLLPTLTASEVLIDCSRRDFEAAITLGGQGIELHPYLQVIRVNYAQALRLAGRLDEALAQYQIASIMSPDCHGCARSRGPVRRCWGAAAMPAPCWKGLNVCGARTPSTPLFMAVFRSATGQPREALGELERAYTENSAWLYTLAVDPQLDALRSEPGFRKLRRRHASAQDRR